MEIKYFNGIPYKLPERLNEFRTRLYVHLINWKWKYITKKPGLKNDIQYDAILPWNVHAHFPIIYFEILPDYLELKAQFPFKFHPDFFNMASSQAATANLFLPVLLHPRVNEILKQLIPDFSHLATGELYKGFRIEYWDGNSDYEKGLLGDHNLETGTDVDIAIAYYTQGGDLRLWLIEHKLTEPGFNSCGGSNGYYINISKHQCGQSFSEIIRNKKYCYYHDFNKYEYWNITEANQSFFVNHWKFSMCPFFSLNQLWRNQLMGFALEKQGKYKQVQFSLVHHPDNHSFDNSATDYKNLIGNNPKFSVLTSADIIQAASNIEDEELGKWIVWYKELYML